MKILTKPDTLQVIPVDTGTGRQSIFTADPIHCDKGDYLSKQKKLKKGINNLGRTPVSEMHLQHSRSWRQ